MDVAAHFLAIQEFLPSPSIHKLEVLAKIYPLGIVHYAASVLAFSSGLFELNIFRASMARESLTRGYRLQLFSLGK